MKQHLRNIADTRRLGIAGGGFTLIEIVVAVAIFGVIAAIIFPALLQFLEMRERVDEKHKQVVGLQKTFLFLANDLRYAVNRLSKDQYGELGKTTMVVDDENLVELVALYPDLNLEGLNVPRRVHWRLNEEVLQRVQFPVMDPDADARNIIQSVLPDVESVTVEVSKIVDGRDDTDNKWDEQTRLPDLIDIEIRLKGGLRYQRLISMVGGDSERAAAATAALDSDSGSDSSSDSDSDSGSGSGSGSNSNSNSNSNSRLSPDLNPDFDPGSLLQTEN